jgi:hypothetical protein
MRLRENTDLEKTNRGGKRYAPVKVHSKNIRTQKGTMAAIELKIRNFMLKWGNPPPIMLVGPNDYCSLVEEWMQVTGNPFMGFKEMYILGIQILPKESAGIECGIRYDDIASHALGSAVEEINEETRNEAERKSEEGLENP